MRQSSLLLKNSKGSYILVAYLFTALLALLFATGFRRISTELVGSEQSLLAMQSFHLAEAGMNRAVDWLRSQPSPPSGSASFDPFNGTQNLGPGTYTVTIDPDDNNSTAYLDHYVVTITAQATGAAGARQVAATFRNQSFAQYAYMTDDERYMPWGFPVWFISYDHLTGPVHTNGQFNISGDPIFDGPVSTANASINYMNGGPPNDNPQFNGGLTLGATAVNMPTAATQLRIAAAGGTGQWFEGNTTVSLVNDGTMLVTNPAAGLVNQPMNLPGNGALFVNGGSVTVSGTLDGQLTIGASNDVIIGDDLQYETDPATDPDSDDVLGIVAEDNVIIANNASGAGEDLTIQATMMALDTSFAVQDWWVGPPKGTLHVLGGVIQVSRGAVGSFNSSTGQIVSGYSKDYVYDTRLSNLAPPHYPTTSDYSRVLWQEN